MKNRGRMDNMVKAWRSGSLRDFSRNASYVIGFKDNMLLFLTTAYRRFLLGKGVKTYTKKTLGMKEG